MCRSTVDIHSATAEIRQGKKERRKKKKPQGKNIMSASATQGSHNKCSSVVEMGEMGDRSATIDMDRKLLGELCPFGGELGPHVTQCGLGRGLPSYQVASSSIQPFGRNRHGPKIGGCAPFIF